MKILWSAEYDHAYHQEIEQLGTVEWAGLALDKGKLTTAELVKLVRDKEIIVTTYDDINEEVIQAAKNLKVIFCTRATPVNIDLHYARKHNVRVFYTPGRNADAVAEITIAFMLSLARNIPKSHSALKRGEFTSPEKEAKKTVAGLKADVIWGTGQDSPFHIFEGIELRGHKLGLVGYGGIGQKVATLARAFGMEVLVYDPYLSFLSVNQSSQRKVQLDELLKEADFVSLHLKVTDETKDFMDYQKFQQMKKSAYFINTARAAILVENDLVRALREKIIAGAALDVFAKEPLYEKHPFIKELDNVVITPHIAGATKQVLRNQTLMVLEDLNNYLAKRIVLHELK